MAHTEFGFQVVKKFLADISPYGHPDFDPKLIGKGINVMISPLPRNKRARNPRGTESGANPLPAPAEAPASHQTSTHSSPQAHQKQKPRDPAHPGDQPG